MNFNKYGALAATICLFFNLFASDRLFAQDSNGQSEPLVQESEIPIEHLVLLQTFFEQYKYGVLTPRGMCDKIMIQNNSTVMRWQIQQVSLEEHFSTYLILVGISDSFNNSSYQAWAIRIAEKGELGCLTISSVKPITRDGRAMEVNSALDDLKAELVRGEYSTGLRQGCRGSGYKPVQVHCYVREKGTFLNSYIDIHSTQPQ